MITYSELLDLSNKIEEEEEEEPIQTSILPPPQSKQSVEEEAQEESDLGDLNQFMANFYARKKLQRQADGTFIPKTKTKSISVENIQEEFSLDDLEDPSHFLHDEWTQRSNRFLQGLSKLQQDSEVTGSKDLYEYFRDEKWSTTRTIQRAFQNGSWTPEMMEDYRFLRQVFDKANLGGAGQIVEATKDIGIDLIADPMNLVTAIASMFTMGAGGVAIQAGARGLAAMAGRHALSRHINTKAAQIAVSPTWQGTLQGMSIGLTEGAIDGSLINAATQISEKQTGLRQGDFDWGELGKATGAGALFGVTLGGTVASVANAVARRSYARAMGNSDISLPQQVLDEKTQKLRNTTPEDIRRFRKASHRYHKMISALPTFGKATTRYLEVAQSASPKLKEFIKLIRYDAFKGVLGKDQIDTVVPNFNIRREMREGKLRVTADKFLSKIIHKGQGALGKHSFYNIKMDPVANKQLFSLLTGDHKFNLKTLYKRYYNINPQTAKTTMDGELKNNWKNIRKVKLHGEEVSPEVIGAAFHVRRTLDKAHTDASFIDVIGTDGKVSGTTSLFNYSKKFIKNYLPHVWIYDALEPNKEALVDLLLNTKHTNLLEGQFPTVKGRIATKEIDLKVIDGELKKKNAAGDYIDLTAQETDQIKIVSSFDEESKQWTKIQNEELEFILTQQGDYDQVTFKNLFKDEGVSSFRELARKKNPNTSEDTIETIARRLKGEALVQNMIDGKYDLHKGLKDVTSDRTAFTQHRAFNELNSTDLFNLGVIETDVPTIFSDYMHKISASIERTSLFGNTKGEFSERWQIPIQKELMDARADNPELTLDIIQEITGKGAGMDADSGIMQLYGRVTGIEGAYIKNPFARGALDTTKVAMRLAYLPLAVVSSFSEPLIALSRADLPDTKDFIKEFSKAAGRQFSKSMKRAIRAGKVVGGKEVRGAPDMSNEDWMEFYQAGIAAEQAMEDRLQGLYGEYHTKAGQYISQQFFKYNLLIPWTQAVQMGAYNFSNARITRILGDLNRGSNFMHQPLTKRAIQRRYEELEEIGINPKEALEEYNQYVIPEINTETITPKGKAWARFDRKDRKIYVNETELQKRYENKAWTKPRVKGVEALPEDQFESLDEFRRFIYSHERHHAMLPKRRKETKGEYENRINQAALNNMNLGKSAQGSFRQSDWKQSDYYDHSLTPASSLFAREIILNPSVAEANTPLWYSHPAAQLFVQFMGYPTAFNNIVLKGMARNVVKNPMINGSKVLAATTLMTGTAMLGNMIRSHGESLDLDPVDQVAEGVRRWGGFGPFEIAHKYIQGKKYGRSWLGPAIKAPLGPLPSVIVDSVAYGQTPFQTGGKMVPGFGLLSPETKREWNKYLGGRRHRDSLSVRAGLRRPHKKKVRDGLATGGIVNIDNATPEPDERVDRMTGLPYNIQAGAAFIDAEERRGFAEGSLLEDNDPQSFLPTPLVKGETDMAEGNLLPEDDDSQSFLPTPLVEGKPDMPKRRWPKELLLDSYQSTPVKAIDAMMEYVEEPITPKQKARQKVKENDMYRVLTRDEEEYATLDKTELVLYSEEDLRPLNVEMDQTFYTSLPEDSRKAKLEAFRDSSTLGLNVSENPVSGNVRLAGKIQFKNVLRLNVDEVTPDTIADQLSIIRTQNVLAAPFLVKPIIKAIKSDLKTRDMVLEMDDQLTQDKRDLIEQSKSFILRQGLLKLGFDAIKYNNGYVLLREHQFLPTEIEEERDARRHGGLLSTLNKRRARYNEGGSTDDENTRQSFRDTAFRMKILGESLRKEDYVKNQEDIKSYRFIQQQSEQASKLPHYTSNERKVAEQWSRVGPTREYTEEELKQKEQYTNKYLMPRNRKAEGGSTDDELVAGTDFTRKELNRRNNLFDMARKEALRRWKAGVEAGDINPRKHSQSGFMRTQRMVLERELFKDYDDYPEG